MYTYTQKHKLVWSQPCVPGRDNVLLEIIADLDRNLSAVGELDDGSTFECDGDTIALWLHPHAAAVAEVHHREMARAPVDLSQAQRIADKSCIRINANQRNIAQMC